LGNRKLSGVYTWGKANSSRSEISRLREIVLVYMIFSMLLCLFTTLFFTPET